MDHDTNSISRRTFLKDGAVLGIAAASPFPPRLWKDGTIADYPLAQIALRDVDITDEFWSPRIEKARDVALPLLLSRETSSRFIDSRIIEAASYFLTKRPDKVLQERAESLFAPLCASIQSRMGAWMNRGDGPFMSTGHFFEAAIAYQQATGDPQLLRLAVAAANDIAGQFRPGKRTDISNHEGIELALVKLYRATGDSRYVRLAKYIVDVRGTNDGGRRKTGPYAQDEVPVALQTRAIGHCVRATYLYCAVTDLAALTRGAAYRGAASRIWEDAVDKRTYITGGIGSYRREENYGDDYDLPNASCWNEICAAVGNTLWNHRMLLMTGDARYADMMERILYNGLVAGMSLQGDRFLYQTPLKTFSGFMRQEAFGPNCCPPNITRLLAQLGTLIYSSDAHNIYINLFIASNARFAIQGKKVLLRQETKYPWDGRVTTTVSTSSPARFALNVRIPGWAQGEFTPGGLYKYESADRTPFELLVNGGKVPFTLNRGFARIEREWNENDVVELELPMEIRLAQADERVKEDRGMVAITRGPVVFCAEALDNKDGVLNLLVPQDAQAHFSYDPTLLGGIGTIRAKVKRLSRNPTTHKAASGPADLLAIPFFTFANRATTEMAVWLARDPARAAISPLSTIASASVATSSCGDGTVADNYPGHNPPTFAQRFYPNSQDGSGHISAISDQQIPVSSEDGSGSFLRLRPQSGNSAWVQYDFARPARVSSVSVYWKDDKQFCSLPEKWNLSYHDGNQWKPVTASGEFGVEPDKFNKVTFAPVHTDRLRLDITLKGKTIKKGDLGPPDANYLRQDCTWYEGGIIEWFINDNEFEATNVLFSHQAPADHALNPDPDSDFWRDAEGAVIERSILGEPDPDVRSQVRSRWTKDNLYFLFWGAYQTLNLKPDPDTVHETFKLWFYDDFELYLGANFQNINLYGEFQISPQSEFLDQAIDASVRRPGWGNEHLWNSGMTVKSRIDQEKKIWYGEMCIPIASIDQRPAAIGNEFRANVYRLQSAGQGKRKHFLAWQPTGEWNPHRPKKFGTVRLVGTPQIRG